MSITIIRVVDIVGGVQIWHANEFSDFDSDLVQSRLYLEYCRFTKDCVEQIL